MNAKLTRALVALVLALSAGLIGHTLGADNSGKQVQEAHTVTAPPEGSVRVIYSLDQKQNDKEIIALINDAEDHIYFAIYEFTLKDIADALVSAKERGIDVRGLIDSGEGSNSYDAPIVKELTDAGIVMENEKHSDGNGIMHVKALVTDKAYAIGSYNWTGSATHENDEILEIGTDPTLVHTYDALLKRLLDTYKGNAAAKAAALISIGVIDYKEAPNHIGQVASVEGVLIDAYTSKSGTVFLDFCESYKSCPFSGVIFADDVAPFGNLSRYVGKKVTLTGKISTYEGKAEVVLDSPENLQ